MDTPDVVPPTPGENSPPPGPGMPGEVHSYGKPKGVGDWKRVAKLVVLVAVSVYGILFVLWNREPVEINFVVAKATIPLLVVLIAMFLFGWLWGEAFGMWRRRRAEKRHQRKDT